MNQFVSEASQRGCTCPRCWLEPDQVAQGELYPIPYGTELVLCPKCGLVPFVAKPEETFRGLKAGKQARAAFWQSTRRRVRRSNDPVGKAKDLPRFKETDLVRLEQGALGFPSLDPSSRPRAIEPRELQVSPYVGDEIKDWLQLMAARAGGTDSDVIRISLSWAFEFRPPLRRIRLAKGKRKHRVPVRLKESEMLALEQLAKERSLIPARYVLCLLDDLARKSTQPKTFLRVLEKDS